MCVALGAIGTRHEEAEPGPIRIAIDRDSAPDLGNQMLHDREAQARAAELAGAPGVNEDLLADLLPRVEGLAAAPRPR